ncbi:thermonuclease family protein [Rossellomorea vietnamensis]|uniref:thermonuclease family protein n=1 Tax=Rossellomorea vietnamensis TaxID=218284 RepID=UPI001E2D8A1D|nr:thermonuclease family protein [Rossellomorea vietnamensis]MCC5804351.1 thermonuclease family protein [Rossellomorea vietnamensis]
MKESRWVLAAMAIIFFLLLAMNTPVAWAGLLIVMVGLYQPSQKKNGRRAFAGWLFTVGMMSIILSGCAAPSEEVDQDTTAQAEKEADQQEKAEEEKKAAEEKKAKEEEQKLAEEEAAKEKAEAEKEQQALADSFGLEEVLVSRVVDGDTVELKDGRKVRFIGVNTPESTTRTEEYGKEASNYTTEKLEGKTVWLQKDVSETDRYNRYLRLVWLEIPTDDMNEEEIRTKMFNADLVLNGYAEPSTYNPDVTYSDYFVTFAREAREKETGLWAYGENGTTKGDLDSKEEKKTSSASTAKSSASKATTEEPAAPQQEYYQNCTELRKVYPDGVASDHPAYASKHDRDKDGWACER